MKTIDIDKKCEEFVRDNGAVPATKGYRGFKHSCCISPNEVICHGVPNQTVLVHGDIVNIDVTTILGGYYGDTCKMYYVGEPSEYAKRLVETTRECLQIGMDQCFPDNRLNNIGYNIAKHAQKNGYSVVYEFCGHGVGLKFHEAPDVAHIADANTGPILKPGMIFTIEPMVNAGRREIRELGDGWTIVTKDRSLSAQWEHTVLVTETGYEVLTLSAGSPQPPAFVAAV